MLEMTVEASAVASPFLGGFQSRAYRVDCNFPASEGYPDTFVQQMTAVERPYVNCIFTFVF
jgi:hypothetical protein